MFPFEKNSGRNIRTARIKLANGWKGRAVLSEASGKSFSKTDWADCLSQPQLLFKDVEKNLKTEGQNCVAVKNLTVGASQLKVVIKRHYPAGGVRQFFRSFQAGKALRNFKTALKLLRCGIPTVAPFAAIYQRQNLLSKQSIYIAEYLENSSNLHAFASKMGTQQLSKKQLGRFALKKQLCRQLATILASLHHNGLWHRDSKASNFIVCKDAAGRYRILLVDMDGIKRYFLWRKSRRFRSLWRLAASLMSISVLNRTDYLRAFTTYCNLTGLEASQRRRIFRELTGRAQAKWLRTTGKATNK